MGIGQSSISDTNDNNVIRNLSNTALCVRTVHKSSKLYNRCYYLYNTKIRAVDVLGIKISYQTVHVYLNDRLIRIIKDVNTNYLPVISIDTQKLIMIHVHESKNYAGIYDLTDRSFNGFLSHVKTIELMPDAAGGPILQITMIKDTLHVSYKDCVLSVDMSDATAITCTKITNACMIRFSNTGNMIATYDDSIITFKSHQLPIANCTDFVVSEIDNMDNMYNVIAIYYVTDGDIRCIVYDTKTQESTNVFLWRIGDQKGKLLLFDGSMYRCMLLDDLDLRSASGAKLQIRDLQVLGVWRQSKLVIRPIIHTTDGGIMVLHEQTVCDVSDGSGKHDYIHISPDTLIVSAGKTGEDIEVYDINKIIPIVMCRGLYRILRSQVKDMIKKSASDISDCIKVVGNIDPMEYTKITIMAADDRECTYDVSDPIIKYCLIVDILSRRMCEIRSNLLGGTIRNRGATNLVYGMTVNTNMTIAKIKSFKIFESILTGDADCELLIGELCTSDSSYDRYHCVLEILDHFYDYTKYILLDHNKNDSKVTDSDASIISEPKSFSKTRQRLALAICYLCLGMVMEYYAREADDSFGINKSDYEIGREIGSSLCDNFQPMTTVMNVYLDRLSI